MRPVDVPPAPPRQPPPAVGSQPFSEDQDDPGPAGNPWGPPSGRPDPGGEDLHVDGGAADRPVRRAALTGALAGGVVGAVVAALVALVVAGGDGRAAAPRPAATIPARPNGAIGAPADVAALAARLAPSVVAVERSDRGGSGGGGSGGGGSGVVVGPAGEVLTNAHVLRVGDAPTPLVTVVTVRFADGSERTARLVGASVVDDLALLQVDGAPATTPAEFASAVGVQVGDDVIAIGNAGNLGGPPTVTRGIVSAVGRDLDAPGGVRLRGLLQTDAAVNAGSSGGPLVDASGSVVGITTAVLGGAQNLGFAIPADTVTARLGDLRDGRGGVLPTAFLGVTTIDATDADADLRAEAGLGDAPVTGALVTAVSPGEAAERSGVLVGDVVVSLGGAPVDSSERLASYVRDLRPGSTVVVGLTRRGVRLDVTVVLGGRTS